MQPRTVLYRGRMDTATSTEIIRLPAHVIVERLAAGDISAREVIDAHIGRLEAIDPHLNAIVAERFVEARRDADAADAHRLSGRPLGALHGLPVTIKDSIDVANMPSTFGLHARRNTIAASDDVHVARLRAAGAIPIAKSNVAQFLAYFESDNPLHGRTVNPWNADRTCGGSSGGEAALIAACGSPLGLGTDIGGSARIPANWCGIAGFKPSAGRSPDVGTGSFSPDQTAIRSEVGVLARTTADIALGLRVINGAMPLGDPGSIDIASLRVAVVASDGIIEPTDAARRAVTDAAAHLAAAGAQVSTWALPDPAEGLRLAFRVLGFDRLAHFRQIAEGGKLDPRVKQMMQLSNMPRPARRLMARTLDSIGQHGLAAGLRLLDISPDGLTNVVAELDRYRQQFAAALAADRIDAIVLPTCPLPAVPHGATKQLATIGSYTILWNALGYPAGTVPFTTVRPDETGGRAKRADAVVAAARKSELGSAGLLIGVQIIAPHGQDHRVLALMESVERASIRSGQHPGHPTI